jgi:predicted transcriptional regulator
MARVAVEIPLPFRYLAEDMERSVNWLAQQAFAEYLEKHRKLVPIKQTKGNQSNASSNRQGRR